MQFEIQIHLSKIQICTNKTATAQMPTGLRALTSQDITAYEAWFLPSQVSSPLQPWGWHWLGIANITGSVCTWNITSHIFHILLYMKWSLLLKPISSLSEKKKIIKLLWLHYTGCFAFTLSVLVSYTRKMVSGGCLRNRNRY